MLSQFFRNFLSQNLTSGPVLKGVSRYPILNSESKLHFCWAAVWTHNDQRSLWAPSRILTRRSGRAAVANSHLRPNWSGKGFKFPKEWREPKVYPPENLTYPTPAGTFEDVFSFHKVGYVSSQACNREGEYSDSLHENVKNLFLLFSLQGTNISPTNSTFEDDFLFPQVGYVSSLEGRGFWQHPNHWHQWVSLLS